MATIQVPVRLVSQSILSVPVTLQTTPPPPPTTTGLDGAGGFVPWFEMCGTEIANGARTVEYIRSAHAAGVAGTLEVQTNQLCSVLYRTDDGSPIIYQDPPSDPAPWYDAHRPESADFLGLVPQTIDGWDATSQRTTTDKPTSFGGAVIGPRRFLGRRITVSGWLLAASYAGQEYGKRWLAHILNSVGCDPCATCDARLRTSCPPNDGSYDSLNLWGLSQVGIVDGPHYTPGPDGCPEYCTFEFTIVAGDPYLYGPRFDSLPEAILNPNDTDGGACIDFETWICGPGGDLQFVNLSTPPSGTTAAIVTITAPDGVGDIVIGTYNTCPPLDIADAVNVMLVPGITGTLVIDSARHVVTYTSPDGTMIDGTQFIQLPSGGILDWLEVSDCEPAKCVSVSTLAASSGGSTTRVQIDIQTRYE